MQPARANEQKKKKSKNILIIYFINLILTIMKKSLFFVAAASALMLTACSSENDVVQSAAQQQSELKELGFDVYTQNATNATRSGRTNVMNNSTLQITGFGVFGYQDEEETPGTSNVWYKSTSTPNYMWNQQVNYNSTNLGWYYSPLKYWPNETNHDSQSSQAGMPDVTAKNNMDKLTFFAYAPWVQGTGASGAVSSIYNNEATTSNGITLLPTNATTGDPKITYAVATDPSQSVDLLWGVAPVGGISYTAVDGTTVSVTEGMPLIDLKKPAVNTSLKFLFQHALARLGVKVQLAADQVSAGGVFDVANSKVTIKEIAITGNFGTAGKLNLNNVSPNKAKWEDITLASSTPFVINSSNGLAKHLCYDGSKNGEVLPAAYSQQAVTGVTTSLADAIQVSNIPGYSKEVTTPVYSATVPYFASATTHTTPTYAAYTWTKGSKVYLQKNLNGGYTDITNTISTTYPNATVWQNIYSLTAAAKIVEITDGNKAEKAAETAYRKYTSTSGDIYMPTGQAPEKGDYIFDETLGTETAPTTASNFWLANSNYFMVIPPATDTDADKKIKVKITYYVSTTDPNLANGVVYTKNEVEKEVILPHLKNGMAYNLKLILGMTSVKLEAEAADWTTTTSEINLPQNTAE